MHGTADDRPRRHIGLPRLVSRSSPWVCRSLSTRGSRPFAVRSSRKGVSRNGSKDMRSGRPAHEARCRLMFGGAARSEIGDAGGVALCRVWRADAWGRRSAGRPDSPVPARAGRLRVRGAGAWPAGPGPGALPVVGRLSSGKKLPRVPWPRPARARRGRTCADRPAGRVDLVLEAGGGSWCVYRRWGTDQAVRDGDAGQLTYWAIAAPPRPDDCVNTKPLNGGPV